MPANVNQSSSFSADIVNYIAEKTLPNVQRQLVAYQFGDPLTLPKNMGTQYTATRFVRLNLPFAPLAEGVPPAGASMTIQQVTAVAQQWGDTVTVTDVADMTIKHPLFQKAIELVALQMAETLERNTFNNLLAGTQINYVNSRGARASLIAGDNLNPTEINRATGLLMTIGAPMFNGDAAEDVKMQAGKPSTASKDPRSMPHYVAIIHPLVATDMRSNSTVVTAWSYSDINRLYNAELGEWGGTRFTQSNMVPFFTGVAQVNGTNGTAGSLATGTYYIQVTGSVAQNGYEQRIHQVSASISVTGPNGSISVTTPNVPGYLFNVYVGTTTSPVNLGLSASGPTVGSLAGNAVQIAPNTAIVITGIGASRVPPAAPATGVTVFPTFIFGKSAYGQVQLDDPKFTYLKTADKSDPLNQLRVVGWKCMYGTILLNQQFFMRIESTASNSGNFG
jgi:N4-gp56 family major capsid protein